MRLVWWDHTDLLNNFEEESVQELNTTHTINLTQLNPTQLLLFISYSVVDRANTQLLSWDSIVYECSVMQCSVV